MSTGEDVTPYLNGKCISCEKPVGLEYKYKKLLTFVKALAREEAIKIVPETCGSMNGEGNLGIETVLKVVKQLAEHTLEEIGELE